MVVMVFCQITMSIAQPIKDGGRCRGSINDPSRGNRLVKAFAQRLVWRVKLRNADRRMKTYVAGGKDGDPVVTLTFNSSDFKPGLSPLFIPSIREILSKLPHERSEQDIIFLLQFTTKLQCFSSYGSIVQRQLAQVVYYEQFEKRRMLIRQGDCERKVYFLVAGRVYSEIFRSGPNVNKCLINITEVFGPGVVFGELGKLDEDLHRKATIVCKEDCEVLTVDKQELRTLKAYYEAVESSKRLDILKQHAIFGTWNDKALDMVVRSSVRKEYPPCSILLRNLSQTSDVVYLCVRGTCRVIQYMSLASDVQLCQDYRDVMAPLFAASDVDSHNRWICVRTVDAGDFFGLGIGIPRTMVITDQQVECLVIDKIALVKYDRGVWVAQLTKELAGYYPSQAKVYRQYVLSEHWQEYKHQLVMDVLERRSDEKSRALARTRPGHGLRSS